MQSEKLIFATGAENTHFVPGKLENPSKNDGPMVIFCGIADPSSDLGTSIAWGWFASKVDRSLGG
jgi:hypothetical protein